MPVNFVPRKLKRPERESIGNRNVGKKAIIGNVSTNHRNRVIRSIGILLKGYKQVDRFIFLGNGACAISTRENKAYKLASFWKFRGLPFNFFAHNDRLNIGVLISDHLNRL